MAVSKDTLCMQQANECDIFRSTAGDQHESAIVWSMKYYTTDPSHRPMRQMSTENAWP